MISPGRGYCALHVDTANRSVVYYGSNTPPGTHTVYIAQGGWDAQAFCMELQQAWACTRGYKICPLETVNLKHTWLRLYFVSSRERLWHHWACPRKHAARPREQITGWELGATFFTKVPPGSPRPIILSQNGQAPFLLLFPLCKTHPFFNAWKWNTRYGRAITSVFLWICADVTGVHEERQSMHHHHKSKFLSRHIS